MDWNTVVDVLIFFAVWAVTAAVAAIPVGTFFKITDRHPPEPTDRTNDRTRP